MDKAEAALFKALTRMRSEAPSSAEIARARTVLEKRFVDETGTYLGRALAYAQAEAGGAGLRAVIDRSAWLGRVRPEDLQRVAAECLTLSNATVYEYEPLSAPARTFDSDTFAATVKAWAPGFDAPAPKSAGGENERNAPAAAAPQIAERGAGQRPSLESVQPLPIRDFSTLNGPKALVREDHSQPKVTVALLFQGGSLSEDTATAGTTELMLRSIFYGTPRRSFSQMTDEFDELGADVRIVVDPDFCGFLLSVLSRNAERAIKLLRDAVEEPAFRDEDIARARLAHITAIRDARDSTILRSRELLFQSLFPGHSYALPPHGREEVVSKLSSEKLSEWHARVIKRALPVAVIVGDTAGSALVSSQLAEAFKRRDPETSIQVRTPRPEPSADKSESRRRGWTAMAVGFPGPKADNDDRVALKVIQAAVNGEGGRLSKTDRERPNPVLAASLSDDLMFAGGAISVVALIQAGNEKQGRALLVAEMERIGREGFDADELAAAGALAVTLQEARLQSQAEHALEYARSFFYLKNAADADSFAERASKVTAEDVKRVASSYFKSAAASAGIVQGTPARSGSPAPSKSN